MSPRETPVRWTTRRTEDPAGLLEMAQPFGCGRWALWRPTLGTPTTERATWRSPAPKPRAQSHGLNRPDSNQHSLRQRPRPVVDIIEMTLMQTRQHFGLVLALTAVALGGPVALTVAQNQPPPRLFRPEDIGLLESPDRSLWQKPDEIMDALNIADGSAVADVGAGSGWFTVRLARRVGPNGRVYAEDIQREMLEAITNRVRREGLDNVETVEGTPEDPRLPAGLDAVLIVGVYAEVEDPISLLTDVAAALKPQGRLGIVDFTKEGGGPGPEMERRVETGDVISDAEAAGLALLSHETFLPFEFLLVFGLDQRASDTGL